MAIKSAMFENKWWIPESEIGSDKPTGFLLRQMCKKDFDIVRHKTQMASVLSMVLSRRGDEPIAPGVGERLQEISSDNGFDSDIYSRCIKEIKNVNHKGVFKESLTEVKDILDFVAGIEDDNIGNQLDDILWRRSTLEEFEALNFTPTSGCSCVVRTKVADQTKE